MSFIKSVRKALGFPQDFDGDELLEEEEEELLDDDEVLFDDPDPSEDDPDGQASGLLHSDPTLLGTGVSEEQIKTLTEGLFDSVLGYFNMHQPELVRKCLDIDTQRTLLLDNLSEELKQRLVAMADQACRSGEGRWATKQRKLSSELQKLKSDYNAARQQREEFQNEQLSALRQKRAMTERIKDLEAKLNTLGAENEQLGLENKCMADRLRRFTEPEPQAQAHPDQSELVNELRQKIKDLNEQLSITGRQLQEAKASLPADGDFPDHAEELHALEAQLEPIRQLKDKAEARVIELTRDIKKSDATILRLQEQIAHSAENTENLQREIQTLRNTIAENLHSHAEAEASLRSQLEQALTNNSDIAAQPKKPRKRRGKKNNADTLSLIDDTQAAPTPKISAIDELMDNTDWFVAAEPAPLKKDPEVEENFGYKEPTRKNDAPDDDRQLTLW